MCPVFFSDVPAAVLDVALHLTNTVPTGPYRGAGRPDITYALERLVDEAAAVTGLDRLELRRRNAVAPTNSPWTTPLGVTYDSVELDSGLMQQLLINLFNNAATALKATEGTRKISLTTGFDAANETAVITITDTAAGLPDDLHDEIFVSRYTGKRTGRGFGLVIVKQIVDNHNGLITYDSRPGDGTTFTISIPSKHPAEPDSETAPAADQVSA